jgi:rhamnosyltransferase
MVTFNPGREIEENVRGLSPQVGTLCIVDNGSRPESLKYLHSLVRFENVELVENNKNLGIAGALNIGVVCALSRGYFWTAIFDQDTTAPPDYCRSMLKNYRKLKRKDRIAALSSSYRYEPSGIRVRFGGPPTASHSFPKVSIGSGTVFKTWVFEKIGFFDEDLFLDYVDFDFFLRMRKNNYRLVEFNNVLLNHRLGDLACESRLGVLISTSRHGALRRCLIARNRLILYRRYFGFDPVWTVRDAKNFLLETLKIIFFEDEKTVKICATAKGVAKGLPRFLSGRERDQTKNPDPVPCIDGLEKGRVG